MRPLLSIVVPFYNEEECVERVCSDLHAALQRAGLQFEIVAVQNGSCDRTPEILDSLQPRYAELRVVDVPVNQGYGYGLRQGLAACSGDILGWIPGDGQVPPSAVPDLVRQMIWTDAAVGRSRRVVRYDGRGKWLMSVVLSCLVRLVLGISACDVDGVPKLMRREVYNALRLRSNDAFIDIETLVKAKRLGLQVCEINVTYLPRTGGRSKVRWLATSIEFVRNVLRAHFLKRDPWGIHNCRS